MRSVGAVLAGMLVALLVYWVGAVMAFLIMHGVPLGSAGGPSTQTDQLVHLVLAAVSGLLGGIVAVRIGRFRPAVHASTVAALLAAGTLVAFANPASRWPIWFAPALAGCAALGALLGVVARR